MSHLIFVPAAGRLGTIFLWPRREESPMAQEMEATHGDGILPLDQELPLTDGQRVPLRSTR